MRFDIEKIQAYLDEEFDGSIVASFDPLFEDSSTSKAFDILYLRDEADTEDGSYEVQEWILYPDNFIEINFLNLYEDEHFLMNTDIEPVIIEAEDAAQWLY